jgi:hypothetical protein
VDSWARWGVAAGALAVLFGAASMARATVTVSFDPVDRFGATPAVITVDPFTAVVAASERANRGITQDRRLRQTFKNATTFNVGEINISFDVTGGSTPGANDTGLKLAFFEVADILASAWTPGTLIKEVTIQPGVLMANSEILRLSLTGGDVFTLPQRNAGTTGYGVEVSTPNALSSDGNPGVLWFTNQDATPGPLTDFYLDGRYYTEGGASTSNRDVGLSLIASSEVACDPGDVNCDTDVNEIDLGIIAAHFRQNGAREDGDLTGNGFIDFDDFDQWKKNFAGAGSGAASFAGVPEPASALLLLCGAAGLLLSAGRRPRPLNNS